MSNSTSSTEALSQLLPHSRDEQQYKCLRRSMRRRRISCWVGPQISESLPVCKTKSKPSSSIETSCNGTDGVSNSYSNRTGIAQSPACGSSSKRSRQRSPLRSPPMDIHSTIIQGSQSLTSNVSTLSGSKSTNSKAFDEDSHEAFVVPVEFSNMSDSMTVDHRSNTVSDGRHLGTPPSNNQALMVRRSSRRRSLAIHNGRMLLGASGEESNNLKKERELVVSNFDTNIQSSSRAHMNDEPCNLVSEKCNDFFNDQNEDTKSMESLSNKLSPVSTAGNISSPKPDVYISSEMINLTMKRYFGISAYHTKPYVTPRLFAGVLCVLEQEAHSSDDFHPVVELFKAYVQAEVASLNDLEIESNASAVGKKTHFCSYDMSSVITPMDTVEDSNLIIEKCIDSLNHVLQVIETFHSAENSTSHIVWLNRAALILRSIQETDDLKIAISSAKIMPFNWPSDRFIKASKCFSNEFSLICSMKFDDTNQSGIFPLNVRKSLGDLIGRAIKYYLRRFFNPVPIPLYSDKDELPDYSSSRSRIHSIIELKNYDGDGQRDTATADGCISSVFSHALKKYHDFIELNQKLLNMDEHPYYTRFCSRQATKRGLKENDHLIQLSSDDIEEVLADIQESHIFLAGIRALRFIHSLLTWPGVDDAIRDVGGWAKVEGYASLFTAQKLSCEVPEESHLVLLSDVDSLITSYEKDQVLFKELESSLLVSLREVWKHFKCGSRNLELLHLNPCIKLFQTELKDGKNTQFPLISCASDGES